MCHTSCWLLDAGSAVAYLQRITDWLNANPNQVVTLLLTNGDNVPITTFASAMDSAGLSKYAYAPGRQLAMTEWPTLQELINMNKRLVMFLDSGANTNVVPYILDEWTYFFETPYDTFDINFPECNLDRPAGSSPNGKMYIVNHDLDVQIGSISIPDKADDPRVNSVQNIEAQTTLCLNKWGRLPNFILVDYYNLGNPLQAERELNHLT